MAAILLSHKTQMEDPSKGGSAQLPRAAGPEGDVADALLSIVQNGDIPLYCQGTRSIVALLMVRCFEPCLHFSLPSGPSTQTLFPKKPAWQSGSIFSRGGEAFTGPSCECLGLSVNATPWNLKAFRAVRVFRMKCLLLPLSQHHEALCSRTTRKNYRGGRVGVLHRWNQKQGRGGDRQVLSLPLG